MLVLVNINNQQPDGHSLKQLPGGRERTQNLRHGGCGGCRRRWPGAGDGVGGAFGVFFCFFFLFGSIFDVYTCFCLFFLG